MMNNPKLKTDVNALTDGNFYLESIDLTRT